MITEELQDWKKYAAQQEPNNEDVEKSFFDAAYQGVQNKVAPFFSKGNFKVGFEIVHKNDDLSKLVGIFIFRVNSELFYMPVFFLNGTIKGTELTYICRTKKFVPSTNEWAEFLIARAEQQEGKGVSMRERQFTRHQMDLRDIIAPPNFYGQQRKWAAFGFSLVKTKAEAEKIRQKKDKSSAEENMLKVWDAAERGDIKVKGFPHKDEVKEAMIQFFTVPEEKALVKAAWDEFTQETVLQDLPKESILRKFVLEDGRKSAIKKIARAASENFKFASALFKCSKPENYMPEFEDEKKAEAKWEPLLIYRSAILKNPGVKKASQEELTRGYQFEDLRKEAEANDYFVADDSDDLESITAPAVYNVLTASGERKEMLVGYEEHMLFPDYATAGPVPSYGLRSTQRQIPVVLVDLESKESKRLCADDNSQTYAYGERLRNLSEESSLKDKPTTGKAWRIVNLKEHTVSEPFYVTKIEKSDAGLDEVYYAEYSKDRPMDHCFFINPDYEGHDVKARLFGANCKYIEVAVEMEGKDKTCIHFGSNISIGDKAELDRFVFSNGYKRASIYARGNDLFFIRENRDDGHISNTGEISEIGAKGYIMAKLAFREKEAETILKLAREKAEKGKGFKFWYEPLEKKGYNIRFADWPEFYEHTNSDFNVLEQPQEQYMIQAQRDLPEIIPPRIGDKYTQEGDGRGGLDGEDMETANPMQLARMSQEKGVGSLFEHGVVGELVRTYDSVAMVEKYLPDLEQGLDRMGRILFLFYWKGSDFSKAFGTDDQNQLENKLTSNFKSFGELVLELSQKTTNKQEGSPSMSS